MERLQNNTDLAIEKLLKYKSALKYLSVNYVVSFTLGVFRKERNSITKHA